MKISRIFLSILVAYIAQAQAMTPEEYCRIYSGLTLAEASKEYEELLSLSNDLNSRVGEFLSKGTPQSDPEFSDAGRELGDAIGRSYALCVCNEAISTSEDCQAFIAHMKNRRSER